MKGRRPCCANWAIAPTTPRCTRWRKTCAAASTWRSSWERRASAKAWCARCPPSSIPTNDDPVVRFDALAPPPARSSAPPHQRRSAGRALWPRRSWRRRPGRGLLAGAVDAPGRGLPSFPDARDSELCRRGCPMSRRADTAEREPELSLRYPELADGEGLLTGDRDGAQLKSGCAVEAEIARSELSVYRTSPLAASPRARVRRCIRRPPGEVPGILPPLPPDHLPGSWLNPGAACGAD